MSAPLPIVIDERGLPRLLPRSSTPAELWPEAFLLLAVARERPGGGQAVAGRYVFVGPEGHERSEGGFLGPAAPEGLVVPGPGPTRSLDGMLDRFVFRTSFKRPRAAVVGYGLAETLMSLQRPWVDRRGVVRLVTSTGDRLRLRPFVRLDPRGMPRANSYRPPIDIRPRGHRGALYEFGWRRDPDPDDLIPPPGRLGPTPRGRTVRELLDEGWTYPTGRFLDLASAAYAFSGEEDLTFAGACRVFGVPAPPDSEAVADLAERIEAMEALYARILAEFALWPGAPWLAPDRALTPASLGKAVRRAAGVPQPLRRGRIGPRKALAAAMAAAGVGPRAETAIRKVSLPGIYADGHSMFGALHHLCRLEEFLTHEIRVRHVCGPRGLAELARVVARCTPEALLSDLGLWPTLRFVARVRPSGDVLPLRGEFAAGHLATATVPVADGSEPLWVTGYDLAESMSRTGRVPEIVEAWVFETGERLPGLRPVPVLDGWTYDPTGTLRGPRVRDDLGRLLAEARMVLKDDASLPARARATRRAGLRVVTNAVVYGNAVEFDPAGTAPKDFTVDTPDGPIGATARAERPGEYAYPPEGAFVVGASRLMLGLLLGQVERAGGCWQWCDTDGVVVVATPEGGVVAGSDGRSYPALSFEAFWEIRGRFAALARASGLPVPAERLVRTDGGRFEVRRGGRGGVPSAFKIEVNNFEPGSTTRLAPGLESFAISQKRYRLGMRDGSGRLVEDPRSKPSRHGLGNFENPSGLSPKAFAAACWSFMIALAEGEEPERPDWLGCPVVRRLRVARPDDVDRLSAVVPELRPFDLLLRASRAWGGGALLARFDPDPGSWLGLDWFDGATGERHPITTASPWEGSSWHGEERPMFAESVESYLRAYLGTADVTMADDSGLPPRRGTRGPLRPRHVRVIGRQITGKESFRIEERRAGWVSPAGVRQVFAADPGHWQRVLEVLGTLSDAELEARGLAPRTFRRLRAGDAPRPRTRAKAEAAAIEVAREAAPREVARTASSNALLVAYLEAGTCRAEGCTQPPEGRSPWCARHRVEARRERWRRNKADGRSTRKEEGR